LNAGNTFSDTATSSPLREVSPGACLARLDRKHPKAAQLDPIAARERGRDRVEDGVDDGLNVPLVQVRVLLGKLLNQFGLDHAGFRSRALASSSYQRTADLGIMIEATARNTIGSTVFGEGESRLRRIPACYFPVGGMTFRSTGP
jgi:hypothetical protein